MIVVYGAAGGGSLEAMAGGGHASIALTGLPQQLLYMSWVRKGTAAFKKFKKGIWSDPIYRVQLPTEEDGNDGGLSEAKAWLEFQKLIVEGKQYAKRMRDELGQDNIAYKNWEEKPKDENEFDLSYTHLYEQYNCVDITKRLLRAAGGYDVIRSIGLPTKTVYGVCLDAGNMHYKLANKANKWNDPGGGFFGEDKRVGKNIIPWGAGWV